MRQPFPELHAHTTVYKLGHRQLIASVVPGTDQIITAEVYALRRRLFNYYIIPGQEERGDRDEFDTLRTSHVTLRLDKELVGVARLKPVCSPTGNIEAHLSAKFDLVDPWKDYKSPRCTLDVSRVGVVPHAPAGSMELLIAAVVDLSAASGLSSFVAFTPISMCAWLNDRQIPFSIISRKTHTAPMLITGSNNSPSFDTSQNVADRFLAHVRGVRE